MRRAWERLLPVDFKVAHFQVAVSQEAGFLEDPRFLLLVRPPCFQAEFCLQDSFLGFHQTIQTLAHTDYSKGHG